MRIRVMVFVLGSVFICLAAMSSYAQQQSDTSLGDIARQMKAQKAKDAKPVAVITNDNIAKTAGDRSRAKRPPTPLRKTRRARGSSR